MGREAGSLCTAQALTPRCPFPGSGFLHSATSVWGHTQFAQSTVLRASPGPLREPVLLGVGHPLGSLALSPFHRGSRGHRHAAIFPVVSAAGAPGPQPGTSHVPGKRLLAAPRGLKPRLMARRGLGRKEEEEEGHGGAWGAGKGQEWELTRAQERELGSAETRAWCVKASSLRFLVSGVRAAAGTGISTWPGEQPLGAGLRRDRGPPGFITPTGKGLWHLGAEE